MDTHEQVEAANASGRTPPSSSTACGCCRAAGIAGPSCSTKTASRRCSPGWPDDPETVEEAKEHPEVFANKTVGQVADHFAEVIATLNSKPVVIGHSFGGLLAQILAGRGLARATVAMSPGAVPRRAAAADQRAAGGLAGADEPAEPPPRRAADLRPVPLRVRQRGQPEDEAKELYETYSVPAPGAPLFQAATANLNPWTEVKVDTDNPDRGPLLILSGEKDHTVPWALSNAAYKQQKDNPGVTEIVEIPGRGHALTIDSGWREVADKSLEFVKRFA